MFDSFSDYGNFSKVRKNNIPEADKNTDKNKYGENVFSEKNSKKNLKLKEKQAKKDARLKKKAEKLEVKNKEKLYRQYRKEHKAERKIKVPIGLKLISVISLILLVSLLGITYLVSYFVSQDMRDSAEDNNKTINSRTAVDFENRMEAVKSSVHLFSELLDGTENDENRAAETASKFFEQNEKVAAICFINSEKNYINRKFFISHEFETSLLQEYIFQENNVIKKVYNGESFIENASPFFNTSILGLLYPEIYNGKAECTLVLFSSEELNETFSNDKINSSFVVNGDGIILVHPDIQIMKNAEDFSSNTLIKMAQSDSVDNIQKNYVNENNEEFIGSIKHIKLGNCWLVTEVKTEIIMGAVNSTQRRNIILTFAVLFTTILIMWIFSKSISVPLEKLTAVTNEINRGNFNTELFETLNTRRKDEIGALVKSTKDERDILNTVTSLTNEGVTKAIVRRQIDFEPHLKDIVIFFSDIRGFTAISDGFNKRFGEKSAGEIIGFLNDYMSRMVNCIKITGGIVDKFEGDAIMACWGVLRNEVLDFEKMSDENPEKIRLQKEHIRHTKIDALNAIRSAVAMRYALMKYNKDAAEFTMLHENDLNAKYKPHIRIGAGLNVGRATVGFMGSTGKMEFTSIGDAVNLASRTESSNKPCGTDILLTEDTYNLLKNEFIRNSSNNFKLSPKNEKYEIVVEMIPVTFEVKGKGKQHFYGVVNMPQFNIEEFFRVTDPDFVLDEDCAKALGKNGPENLNQLRELLGIPVPDFSKVNLNEEESKVKAT